MSIFLTVLFTGVLYSQEAPNFSFLTIDEEIQQLSDLRGNVLYLSFWASWCKPCINNFNKYEEMRNQLDEMGVMLLNVNIDKNKTDWESAMDKHHINGVHVRGIELESLQELYKLYSIPSYEIINKDGEFVFLSDKVDRNIIEEFSKWVNK